MTPPVPTTIATGFNSNDGCAYRRDQDQLFLIDGGNGTISAVAVHTHAKTVLGTGYSLLAGIALSADGEHAYISEGTGNLLRAPLSNLNRAAATVVAGGLSQGWGAQIGLDEAHGYAYVFGGTVDTKLKRVTLASGAITTVANGLQTPRGVLASRDGRFVYVSDDSGVIIRYDLAANTQKVLVSGLKGPRHLAWSDASESVIVFGQNGPPAMVMKLDLTTPTPSLAALAGPIAGDPYSLAVAAPDHLLIATRSTVAEVYLTSAIYSANGPILLGIGFVPADTTHLPGGYADTTMDQDYFCQVKNAPFGGTLPLMINYDRARTMGANFYKVEISAPKETPVAVNQAYSDYRWNAVLNRFELVTQVPVNGFYPVHAAGEIWLNYWLGLLLNTVGRPNGLNTISIRLFKSQNETSEIGNKKDPGRAATLMIDNTLPVATIHKIVHDGAAVKVCQIVDSGSPTFGFVITAQAQQHLRGWDLTAYWG